MFVTPAVESGYVIVRYADEYHVLELGTCEGRHGPFYCKVVSTDKIQTESWDSWFGCCYSRTIYDVYGYAPTMDDASRILVQLEREN